MVRFFAVLVSSLLPLLASGCLKPLTDRMDRLSGQMDEVNARLGLANEQMAAINDGLSKVNKGVVKLNEEMDELNGKLDKTGKQLVLLDDLNQTMSKAVVSANSINKKIGTIEELINRIMNPKRD